MKIDYAVNQGQLLSDVMIHVNKARKIRESGIQDETSKRAEQQERNEATKLIIEGLGESVLKFFYRCARRGEAEADDWFQTWSIRLLGSLRSYAGNCSPRTWAFKIAWQVKSRRRAEYTESLDSAQIASLTTTTTSIVTKMDRRQTASYAVLTVLTDEELELLILKDVLQLEWEEITEIYRRHPWVPRVFTTASLNKKAQRARKKANEAWDSASGVGIIQRDLAAEIKRVVEMFGV